MNYRHAYHTGNFADAFKHIVLVALTKAFLRKETPFCYLDTHAGTGSYDLTAYAPQRSKEFETGISKIISQLNPPELVQHYLQIVQKNNVAAKLRFYPGSPYFVKQMLRKTDRMILSELHPEDVKLLKRFFPHDKQVAVHAKDAYES